MVSLKVSQAYQSKVFLLWSYQWDNRKTQANFKCVKCGYENNADENASVNIAQAGHAWIARLYIDVNFFLRFSSLKLAF